MRSLHVLSWLVSVSSQIHACYINSKLPTGVKVGVEVSRVMDCQPVRATQSHSPPLLGQEPLVSVYRWGNNSTDAYMANYATAAVSDATAALIVNYDKKSSFYDMNKQHRLCKKVLEENLFTASFCCLYFYLQSLCICYFCSTIKVSHLVEI